METRGWFGSRSGSIHRPAGVGATITPSTEPSSRVLHERLVRDHQERLGDRTKFEYERLYERYVRAEIARVAWIIPSSIGHGFLRCVRLGLSVRTPWQLLRGVVQEAPKHRDVSPRRSLRGRMGITVRALWAPYCGFSPRGERGSRAAVDQKTA